LFSGGQGSSTDDPNPVTALGVSDHQQPPQVRQAHRDVAMLAGRVGGVRRAPIITAGALATVGLSFHEEPTVNFKNELTLATSGS
jgi:hypothetical protein